MATVTLLLFPFEDCVSRRKSKCSTVTALALDHVHEYDVTRSRQGLIGVTALSRRANRFTLNKAGKTPPSCITSDHPSYWSVPDFVNAQIWEITGGELSRRIHHLPDWPFEQPPERLQM